MERLRFFEGVDCNEAQLCAGYCEKDLECCGKRPYPLTFICLDAIAREYVHNLRYGTFSWLAFAGAPSSFLYLWDHCLEKDAPYPAEWPSVLQAFVMKHVLLLYGAAAAMYIGVCIRASECRVFPPKDEYSRNMDMHMDRVRKKAVEFFNELYAVCRDGPLSLSNLHDMKRIIDEFERRSCSAAFRRVAVLEAARAYYRVIGEAPIV